MIEPPKDSAHASCPACGYSLAGIDSDRCPECGIELSAVIAIDASRHQKFRRGALTSACVNASLIAIIAVWNMVGLVIDLSTLRNNDKIVSVFVMLVLWSLFSMAIPAISCLLVFVNRKTVTVSGRARMAAGRYLSWVWFPLVLVLVVGPMFKYGRNSVVFDALYAKWFAVVLPVIVLWNAYVVMTTRVMQFGARQLVSLLCIGNLLLAIYGFVSWIALGAMPYI